MITLNSIKHSHVLFYCFSALWAILIPVTVLEISMIVLGMYTLYANSIRARGGGGAEGIQPPHPSPLFLKIIKSY